MKMKFRIIAMTGVLAFFFFLIGKNLSQLDWSSIRPNGWSLVGAFLFVQLAFSMNILGVQATMRYLGVPVSFKTAYTMYFVSNIGRYVPGRIWQIMSMGYIAKKNGIPFTRSFFMFAMNQGLAVVVNLLFAIVFIRFLSHQQGLLARISLFPLAPLVIFLVYPDLIVKILNMGARVLKRAPYDGHISYSYTATLSMIYFASNLCTGLGFLMLIQGIGLKAYDPFFLMAVYPLAYIIGYLALITPGGIGVREGIIIFLLKLLYPADTSSLIALAALLWAVLAEATNSLIALWLSDALVHKRDGDEAEIPQSTSAS